MDEAMRTRCGGRVVKRLVQTLAGVLCGIGVLVGIAYWYESDWGIYARRERIAAAALRMGPAHPWAGSYYRGDGLGCNEVITLSPDEGYQYTNHGCLGLYAADHGSVAASGGRIVLWASILCCPPLQRREFIPVAWGSRRYLLQPEQMLDFVNAINQHGHESYEVGLMQDRSFYLRLGDEDKPLEGLPEIAPEYRRLLLVSRIEGTVTAVSNQGVDLDLGLDRGVFQGMELYLLGEGSKGFGKVDVYEVMEHASRGRVRYMDSDSPPIAVGWQAVSRIGD
jgi:hypothetical protein